MRSEGKNQKSIGTKEFFGFPQKPQGLLLLLLNHSFSLSFYRAGEREGDVVLVVGGEGLASSPWGAHTVPAARARGYLCLFFALPQRIGEENLFRQAESASLLVR